MIVILLSIRKAAMVAQEGTILHIQCVGLNLLSNMCGSYHMSLTLGAEDLCSRHFVLRLLHVVEEGWE